VPELSKGIFGHISLHDAELPYNLNWLSQPWSKAVPFLHSHPITVFDIGARGGSLGELDRLKKFIRHYGFDADSAEAEALQQKIRNDFYACRLFPYFIGADKGPQDFHLYKAPGCSSALRPSPAFAQFGVEGFEIEKTVTVNSISLDAVIEREHLEKPDLIKLDTQGTELGILKAAPRAVSDALMVEVEVEFYPQYEGQPLFQQVAQFMDENGFQLLYLNRVFLGRRKYKGPTRGQLIFGDALFGRRDIESLKTDVIRSAKYALLLINYGHMDQAFELVNSNPAIRECVPEIDSFFRLHSHPRSQWIRAAGMQLDKLIAFLLWVRGTNQRSCDSDRSWPIR